MVAPSRLAPHRTVPQSRTCYLDPVRAAKLLLHSRILRQPEHAPRHMARNIWPERRRALRRRRVSCPVVLRQDGLHMVEASPRGGLLIGQLQNLLHEGIVEANLAERSYHPIEVDISVSRIVPVGI